MSEGRSPQAQRLLDDVAARSGLEPEKANAATCLVADYLLSVLTPFRIDDLRKRVPEFDELAVEGSRLATAVAAGRSSGKSTLAGRLFSSVGGMVGGHEGGPVAKTVALIGNLGKIGLGMSDMQALSSAMIGGMRERAGDAWVNRMVAGAKAKIPFLGRYLG